MKAGIGGENPRAGPLLQVIAERGAVIHHPPTGESHPQAKVNVLEVLDELRIEVADFLERPAADHEETTRDPVARPGCGGGPFGIRVPVEDAAKQPPWSHAVGKNHRQRLKTPGGRGVAAIGPVQPAAGNAAVGMRFHESHHLRHALFFRIEVHVRVEQQHVRTCGDRQHAVEVRSVVQPARVADHRRIGKVPAPLPCAVGGGVIHQDQPQMETLAGKCQRRHKPRHVLPFVGIHHADVNVGRGQQVGRLPSAIALSGEDPKP